MTEEEIQLIEETRMIIRKYKNLENGMDIIREQMNKMYRYFKKTITLCDFSEPRLLEIFRLEKELEDKFLPLKSEPDFDKEKVIDLPNEINNETDALNMMDYIIHKARLRLSKFHDLKTATLEKQCIDTSWDIKQICDRLGVKQKNFDCAEDLSGGTFHCFNFVSIPLKNGTTKTYLVDCTYRQFFTYADSFLERIGIPMNLGPNMGSYMMMNETRKKIAEELLVKGYIELTPEVIKTYFDAFVYTGRNGLYYESLGKETLEPSDYEPHYTYEEYLMALSNGGLKKENFIERQKEPLKFDIIFDNNGEIKKTK